MQEPNGRSAGVAQAKPLPPPLPGEVRDQLARILDSGPERTRRAEVFVVGNLSHVEIHPGAIPDTLLLWRAAYRLLTLRDGLTVPDPARCALSGGGTKTGGSGRRRRSATLAVS